MADQFDRAQELDAWYRNQAMAAREQGRANNEATAGLHCTDCGDEIPEGRRLAAPWCTRCTDCQQEWEDDH